MDFNIHKVRVDLQDKGQRSQRGWLCNVARCVHSSDSLVHAERRMESTQRFCKVFLFLSHLHTHLYSTYSKESCHINWFLEESIHKHCYHGYITSMC